MHIRATSLPETDTDLRNLRALLPFLWNYRGRVFLALGFLVLAKVANVGIPLVLKEIVDRLDSTEGLALVLPLAFLVAYGALRLSLIHISEPTRH